MTSRVHPLFAGILAEHQPTTLAATVAAAKALAPVPIEHVQLKAAKRDLWFARLEGQGFEASAQGPTPEAAFSALRELLRMQRRDLAFTRSLA